jgi:hypothetical protein
MKHFVIISKLKDLLEPSPNFVFEIAGASSELAGINDAFIVSK